MPPLRYWLFTPELQWQPKGQTAYLTGRAGSAVTLPSRHSSHQRYACLSPLAQWLCEIRVRYVSPCEIRRIRTVCILHGEGWLYIPTPLPVRYTLCRSWFTCRQTSLSYREVIYAPSPPRSPPCKNTHSIHTASLTGRGLWLYNVSRPFNTGCSPLKYSGNPGVNVSHRQGGGCVLVRSCAQPKPKERPHQLKPWLRPERGSLRVTAPY